MELLNWQEWSEEPLIIQIHMVVAIGGIILGGYAMLARKGTRRHKLFGRGFAVLALATALTSFFIHEIRAWGPWSPIHLLSIFTVVMIWRGVVLIRARRIAAHQFHMQIIFLSGFVVATAFTFLPGRLPYQIFLETGLERIAGDKDTAERIALVIPVAAILFSCVVLVRTWRQASR